MEARTWAKSSALPADNMSALSTSSPLIPSFDRASFISPTGCPASSIFLAKSPREKLEESIAVRSSSKSSSEELMMASRPDIPVFPASAAARAACFKLAAPDSASSFSWAMESSISWSRSLLLFFRSSRASAFASFCVFSFSDWLFFSADSSSSFVSLTAWICSFWDSFRMLSSSDWDSFRAESFSLFASFTEDS